ncbi:MAG TPA: carboxypeptidase-like regulatory domain-containing protein [Thermoanaerobaculia bacterium]|nr:carboxypeptidase-like regulatory domain-containing protein [Thermoanaerobaculia bacterium]
MLRAPAMTPHYRWDVAVADGRPTDLGTFRLRPGASFVAYLDGDTVRLLTKPARARLFRPVGAVASETAARLALPVAEAEFTSRGWVQLALLPPGTYVLEVSAEGFAPAQIGSIEIYEGKESSFRKAIALFPPLRVSVTVRPPVDLGEKPWRVTWNRVGDFTPETASIIAYTNREGVATIENQSPGAFHVQVDDVNRNSVHSSDVRIDGPETAVVPIRPDLLVVKGQVVQGEEPLAAELRFGGSDGAIGTYVRTDEEGAFETRLPRLGRWPVEVRNDRGVGTLLQVDVERDEDLLLRIPDTSVAGWVVSESGERVKRGSVTVLVAGRGLGTTLDDRGEFRMNGLPAGVVQIVGRDRTTGDSSEFVRLDLREGQPRENVELRIERSRRITGTVSSAGQPVVGAQITAAALDTGAITKEAVTDLSGRFNLLLPVRVRRAHFTVPAPSRTLQTFDLPLSDQPIVLDVAASGGTLIIRSAPGATTPYRVRRNGVAVHLPSLLSWMSAHGHPLTDVENLPVPNLAPVITKSAPPQDA